MITHSQYPSYLSFVIVPLPLHKRDSVYLFPIVFEIEYHLYLRHYYHLLHLHEAPIVHTCVGSIVVQAHLGGC